MRYVYTEEQLNRAVIVLLSTYRVHSVDVKINPMKMTFDFFIKVYKDEYNPINKTNEVKQFVCHYTFYTHNNAQYFYERLTGKSWGEIYKENV